MMATIRRKRGLYKRYLNDPSVPIPKQTLSNWRQRGVTVEKIDANYMEMESQTVPSESDSLQSLRTSPAPVSDISDNGDVDMESEGEQLTSLQDSTSTGGNN